jgi:hypothetical protein
MAYTDIYSAATDDTHVLRKQLAVAIHQAAQKIITGTISGDMTWARKVSNTAEAPVTEASRWVWKLLENSTVQADPLNATDSDVQWSVENEMLDVMAGRGGN